MKKKNTRICCINVMLYNFKRYKWISVKLVYCMWIHVSPLCKQHIYILCVCILLQYGLLASILGE